MRQKKRRVYPIVDRSLQYRFLAVILCYCMLIVIVLALFLFVPDLIKLLNEELSIQTRAAAADKVLTLHSRLWPAVITLVCCIGLHSVGTFHRFMGPVYRFRRAFAQVKSGDLSLRIKLRRKDYLHQEEEAFNKMVQTFAEKWGDIQLACMDALKCLGDLEEAMRMRENRQEAYQELLTTQRRHLEHLVDVSRYFQVHPRDEDAGV
ncbi:MAG: hypothetical protein ACLFVT_05500 [Syntrophobacteria bacterium]